ncbi:MAG: NusG domain II-containing protein [Bacteroidetes bacterium]|nr:NusG domain II-containing protein [Bacteroidota bacterium]
MINRRDFLKISGLAVVALGSGAGLRKLFTTRERDITLAALLPDNNRLIAKVINELAGEADIRLKPSTTLLMGESTLVSRLRNMGFSPDRLENPNFVISISRIPAGSKADIFVKTGDFEILTPETGFTSGLKQLRREIKDSDAALLMSIRPFAAYDSKKEKFVVIESEGKQVEKVSLTGVEKEIKVYGGNLISVGNGRAFVKEHGCKHGICRSMGHIALPGDMIACAPHKTVITVV